MNIIAERTPHSVSYRPRHSWGEVRFSTTRGQLEARLAVVDAAGEPAPRYAGRHRAASCSHDHVEQIGTDALGNPITECLACGDGAGELITDPAEIEQIKERLQYTEGQYEATR